ncbi:MAG: hypothetical protein Q4B33_04220 [Fusobacterium sp.]|nr:hypothetical protein [Fusobacterium sp.]
MKKIKNKKNKKKNNGINLAVKIFLFPLFIFGLILRGYDRIFKKNEKKTKVVEVWH